MGSRQIHANPEPGFEEKNTNKLLRKMLVMLAGIDEGCISDCAGTGIVADIVGVGPPSSGKPKVRSIALRADMDALRMTEGNTTLPYRSKNQGVAHMCGHDGHMASLVGAASLINRRAHSLPSNCRVRLLFQPAEEGPGGAVPMIEAGCLDGVDECYGYHNWPPFKLGYLHVRSGPVMAHPTAFKIEIVGCGGHGSQPHLAVDPVLVAAHVVVALQSVVSRSVPSAEQAVVSVTMIHGGEATNVIPDKVTLQGTTRDLSPETYDLIVERIRAIVDGTCAMFGAKGTIEMNPLYDVLVNHKEQTEVVQSLARRHFGEDRVKEDGLPILGAEDFSYYLQKVPGCFFFLGGNERALRNWSQTGAPGERSNCMCHNTAFDFNDNVLPIAAVFWVRLVEQRLGVSLYSDAELPLALPPADDDDSKIDSQNDSRKENDGKVSKRSSGKASGSAPPPPPEAGAKTAADTIEGPIVLKQSKRARRG